MAGKWIPGAEPSPELSEEELEGVIQGLATALLGRETFYWTIEGLTLLEARVPGGFEVMATDARKKREGCYTILAYEGSGTLMFQCAAPRGEPVPLPKEFKVAESRETDERSIQWGSTRVEKQEMFWRQDTFKDTAVHVMCCVTSDLEKPFVEAIESAALLERTAEMEAFFQSCLAPAAKRKGRGGKR